MESLQDCPQGCELTRFGSNVERGAGERDQNVEPRSEAHAG